MSIQNGHGGARTGAGRKPKALIYANEIAMAEAMMVGALPRVTAKLIALAEAGDVSAIRLLFDRIMGRAAQLEKPLTRDTSIPYVEEDWKRDLTSRFLDDFDTDEMHNRQFEDRFYDMREEDAAKDGAGAEPESEAEEGNSEGAEVVESSTAHATTGTENDSDETPRYYYVGSEVKFGIPPPNSTPRPSSPPESRNGQTPHDSAPVVD